MASLLTSPFPSQRGITPDDIRLMLNAASQNRRSTNNDLMDVAGQQQDTAIQNTQMIQSALNTSARLAEERQAREQQLLLDTANAITTGIEKRRARQRQEELDEQNRIQREREEERAQNREERQQEAHDMKVQQEKRNYLDDFIQRREEQEAKKRREDAGLPELETELEATRIKTELDHLEKRIQEGEEISPGLAAQIIMVERTRPGTYTQTTVQRARAVLQNTSTDKATVPLVPLTPSGGNTSNTTRSIGGFPPRSP